VQNLQLEFDSGFNFFFGKNAQGKTNIIEAIHYLSQLKSFRTSDKTDLIQKNADFAQLSATIHKDALTSEIEITLTPNGRQTLVNGKKPKSQKEYGELLPVLLFEPRHIYLWRDAPSERRKYLNRALYLQDPGFLEVVRDYEKIITQKNKILKEPSFQNGSSRMHLEVWNERLAEVGAAIIVKRLNWFATIAEYLSKEYQAVSQTSEVLRFVYQPSENLCAPDALPNQDTIQKNFHALLCEKQNEEMARREAFVGPHRDDFSATLDARNIALYGSQGENRSAVIALKLSQLKMFFAAFQKMPAFLLDDVASELDAKRCEALFTYLRDKSVQAFLTTTENDRITRDFGGKSLCFEVCAGDVIQAQ